MVVQNQHDHRFVCQVEKGIEKGNDKPKLHHSMAHANSCDVSFGECCCLQK